MNTKTKALLLPLGIIAATNVFGGPLSCSRSRSDLPDLSDAPDKYAMAQSQLVLCYDTDLGGLVECGGSSSSATSSSGGMGGMGGSTTSTASGGMGGSTTSTASGGMGGSTTSSGGGTGGEGGADEDWDEEEIDDCHLDPECLAVDETCICDENDAQCNAECAAASKTCCTCVYQPRPACDTVAAKQNEQACKAAHKDCKWVTSPSTDTGTCISRHMKDCNDWVKDNAAICNAQEVIAYPEDPGFGTRTLPALPSSTDTKATARPARITSTGYSYVCRPCPLVRTSHSTTRAARSSRASERRGRPWSRSRASSAVISA